MVKFNNAKPQLPLHQPNRNVCPLEQEVKQSLPQVTHECLSSRMEKPGGSCVEEQEGRLSCFYTAMRERKQIPRHLEIGEGKPLTQSSGLSISTTL